MEKEKKFPEGMVPLGNEAFRFDCHSDVRCFTCCCKNVDLFLYPYDVIRLKTSLSMPSFQFLQQHTRVVKGQNPFFPSVMLKMKNDDKKTCPFLEESGCSVYGDRPSSCRMYPLERAVDRMPERRRSNEHYFLVKHPYCYGHEEQRTYTVREWIRDQRLDEYNLMNELWTEIDTIFSCNPWCGEGVGGRRQQLAFMVCYDIDGFRQFALEKLILEQYSLPKEVRRNIITSDDLGLMKFGFEWLKSVLTGKSSLIRKY